MRKILSTVCLLSLALPAMASCDDVKSQIDAKLQAKGVKSYTLEIIPVAQASTPPAASGAAAATPAQASTGKVVGSCENDTKQIIYKRN